MSTRSCTLDLVILKCSMSDMKYYGFCQWCRPLKEATIKRFINKLEMHKRWTSDIEGKLNKLWRKCKACCRVLALVFAHASKPLQLHTELQLASEHGTCLKIWKIMVCRPLTVCGSLLMIDLWYSRANGFLFCLLMKIDHNISLLKSMRLQGLGAES